MSLAEVNTQRNVAAMKKWNELAKARMKEQKLTQEKLAETLGVTQGAIAHWLSGRREPDLATINRILSAVGLPGLQMGSESNADPGPMLTTPFRSVKIAGTAQLGAEGYWTALSPSDGHVDIPTRDKDAYALRLRGDSMSPAIRSGWVAVCEPNSQLIPGEYVHIKLKGFDGEGESMVKELLYANEEEISVMSINDAFGRRTLALADIEYIHPVPFIVAPSKIVQ
ncbi:LexA family transcriptional regulator [Pseudomonas oryzihabitans]|uniref:LexA family transcriptional regulator n=1 Tax=Pseudomonas oryzihabitans TaxID=47885 RepID=UPI0028A19FCE|nr:LexA family transcriptional regulator [Pseudomonas oryzihabitans]